MLKNIKIIIPVLVAVVIAACLLVATYARNKVYKTPVTLWEDASSKSAMKRRTHENYGQALSTAGFYPEALRQFETVLALKDDGSVPMRDLYREMGVVFFRMGLFDDSISAWETGLKHAPSDPSILNNLSVVFIKKGRIEEAEAVVRQALSVAPYMPHLLNTLGEILMSKGKYEEALQSFLAAIQQSPDVAARYWNAAIAFERIGKYDMSYQYANQYAAMEPDPALRKNALGLMEALQQRMSKKRAP